MGAVGVGEDQAALFDVLFELGDGGLREGEFLIAGDVEDGCVVEVVDGGAVGDDLPGELPLGGVGEPAGENGDVARSLVPVAGVGVGVVGLGAGGGRGGG